MEQGFVIAAKIGEETRRIPADGSQTLLELLRGAGIAIEAPCGGNGTCGQCRVRVMGPCRFSGGMARDCVDEDVLACQVRPAGDLDVTLNKTGTARILTDAADIPSGGDGLGLAVDLGTTTVAAYLYDLASGICLGARGALNVQRSWGGDVISRIRHAKTPEGLDALCLAIRDQIRDLAGALCPDTRQIRYVSIAGNTVMEHLFAGLSPESIGVAPFTPLCLFGAEEPASKYMDCFSEDCVLYLCPAVAGYVGGDITAGLLSSGAYLAERQTLFIDIGTNGEICLGGKDGFLCCAAAAGPAFEGAEIACGSPAVEGAISAVETDLSYTVIGDVPPRSICGSGLIDAVAALLHQGIIDRSGRMKQKNFVLGGDVFLSLKDVRKLQLAKAAIRAGIETLLERGGVGYEDVGEVLLAGGFGMYLRTESACAIGMLPPPLRGKIRPVGNAAGKGAAMALTPEARRELARVHDLCRYEELSASPLFRDKFLGAMTFDGN